VLGTRTIVCSAIALAACGGDAVDPDAREVDARGIAPIAPDAANDPDLLSSSGLFANRGFVQLAEGVRGFEPRYRLWSDGAVKTRWFKLPDNERIDSSDAAHWRLPVGTKMWKEFDAPDGRKLETRLIERIADTGDDDLDYRTISFVWLDDESDAVAAPDGAENVRGTDHDVPSATRCRTCHTGEPGFALGLTALQLSGDGEGVRLADLRDEGRLSTPVADYEVPGDPVAQAALGYLHANCGHCHNPNGSARPDVDMTLQLGLDAVTPEATTTWQSTVGVALTRFSHAGYSVRIDPGAPDTSAVLYRMTVRDAAAAVSEQMPPIATEYPDAAAIEAVRAWIAAIPPP